MKFVTLVASASVLVLAGMGAAFAGPCSDQIASVEKIVNSSDAGSGPTLMTGSADQLKSDLPKTTGSVADQTGAKSAANGAEVSATPREVPKAGEAPKTGATVAMNAITQDRATSPQDVRSQTTGQPTTSQVARSSTATANPDRVMKVNAALDRARTADQQGNLTACTDALAEARQLLAK